MDLYASMNIKSKTLYERYLKIVPEKYAFIMGVVEGGQPELATSVLRQEREDQDILREETHRCLVPREELYPVDEQGAMPPQDEQD